MVNVQYFSITEIKQCLLTTQGRAGKQTLSLKLKTKLRTDYFPVWLTF